MKEERKVIMAVATKGTHIIDKMMYLSEAYDLMCEDYELTFTSDWDELLLIDYIESL